MRRRHRRSFPPAELPPNQATTLFPAARRSESDKKAPRPPPYTREIFFRIKTLPNKEKVVANYKRILLIRKVHSD